MRTTVPSTHIAAPPRVDLTKRITPVLTHHGRTLARFSDRATAVRRAREWGGCVVGATFTDAGTLRNATPAVQLYGPTATAHPRYVHPDAGRAFATVRFLLNLDDTQDMTWSSPWARRIRDAGDVWTVDGSRWWAILDSDPVRIGRGFLDALSAVRYVLTRR